MKVTCVQTSTSPKKWEYKCVCPRGSLCKRNGKPIISSQWENPHMHLVSWYVICIQWTVIIYLKEIVLKQKTCFGGEDNLFKTVSGSVRQRQNSGIFSGFHAAGLTKEKKTWMNGLISS